MDYKRIKKCRACDSIRLRSYLKFGKQPLANALLTKPSEKPEFYPLEVLFCLDCSLSQLSVVVDPDILYANYPYHSSVSETFRKHCRDLAKTINRMLPGTTKSMIDIASNDGCLIGEFSAEGGFNQMIGYEPCGSLVHEAQRKHEKTEWEPYKSVEFKNTFWDERGGIRSDVITALNVLAHVNETDRFIKGVEDSLNRAAGSFCVIEVPYLVDLLYSNAFDTIYHEHLSYFLLRPLRIMFERSGLRIFKVERIPIHGGSIRIYGCLKEYLEGYYEDGKSPEKTGKDYNLKYRKVSSTLKYPEDPSVKRLEEFEKQEGFHRFTTYLGYARKLRDLRDKLQSLLTDLRQREKRVAAYGASAKGISLINYCGLTNNDISYIADDTKAKQGKFTPGASIPIVSRDHFDTNHPDYIALLSWNFSAELKQKTKHLKAKYITPIPEVSIS